MTPITPQDTLTTYAPCPNRAPPRAPTDNDPGCGQDVNGIIIHLSRPLIEVDKFTQVNVSTDSSKTVLSDNCTNVPTRKLISLPDWDHPYILHYDHGILETYTFGATLTSDGILTNINAQSTPDQGKTIANLTSAASSAAGIARLAPPAKAVPNCTTTPVFYGYERPPTSTDIKAFGTTDVSH
jgi:hypothetical protein